MNEPFIRRVAAQHNIRIVCGSVDASEKNLLDFVETLLKIVAGGAETYCLWSDGTYCELSERSNYGHMSDDYRTVYVHQWDDNGEPIFPGGLR